MSSPKADLTVPSVRRAVQLAGLVVALAATGACATSAPLRSARDAERAQDYDRAVVEYSKALQARPNDALIRSQLEAARANARRARADYTRLSGLADKQIVSRQALDAAQAAVDAADASVTALERQVSAAGAGVTSAEAGVRLARARYDAARAARDNAALQLSYVAVLAPASGVISRKTAEVGQLLQAGQPVSGGAPTREVGQ